MTGTISSDRKEKSEAGTTSTDTAPAVSVPRIRGGAARASAAVVPPNDSASGAVDGISSDAIGSSSTDPADAAASAATSAQLSRTRTPRESIGSAKRPISAVGARVSSLRASMDGAIPSSDGVSSPQARGGAAAAPSPRQRQKPAVPVTTKSKENGSAGHDGVKKAAAADRCLERFSSQF
jgi:hypothetical protein